MSKHEFVESRNLHPSEPGAQRRRTILSIGVNAALLAAVLSLHMVAGAQSNEPIKIGLVAAKTGPWTEQGTAANAGAEVALSQAGGKVLGRPVQIIWYDEPNPQSSVQNMLKLIQQDKVVSVVGGGNSATVLAMSAVAKDQKTPYIAYGGAAREVTGAKCNKYTFRGIPTVPTVAKVVAPHALAAGKKWYFVMGAYAFGVELHDEMKKQLDANGGTEVGYDQVPVGTSDYSALILKIRQARPDVVILGNAGNDVTAFMSQFAEFGLKGKIAVVHPFLGVSDLWAMPASALAGGGGLFGTFWDRNDPGNTPEQMKLDAAIQAKLGRPAGQEYYGWAAMRMMLAGIEKAGSTDPDAIVKGLETVELPGGLRFRPWDHQLMHRYTVLRAKQSISSKWEPVDWVATEPKDAKLLDSFHGTKEEVGCKM